MSHGLCVSLYKGEGQGMREGQVLAAIVYVEKRECVCVLVCVCLCVREREREKFCPLKCVRVRS